MLLLLLACGGDADVATPAPSPLDSSWVGVIVREPARFSTVTGGDRAGWIALHKNAWPEAATGAGVTAARAQQELATFHEVLADLSDRAWHILGTTWEQRGTLPTDSALPRLVALAEKDAGEESEAARWQGLPGRDDPRVAERVALHEAWRKGEGTRDALLTAASAALVEETVPDGVRTLWDPLLHRSLAVGYTRGAGPAVTDPLERDLFSSGLDPADPGVAAGLTRLALTAPATDDADACRELARGLDRQLDAWQTVLDASAPEEGKALLHDLRLIPGLRSRVLTAWGVEALRSDHPRCAGAYAELALDHEHPREITPLNPPTLFAVAAAANLRTGRTREALDALQVLSTAYPEIHGLDETVGDLAVLQGLDRNGVSREN